jgi:ELWxxDGT repeat protein
MSMRSSSAARRIRNTKMPCALQLHPRDQESFMRRSYPLRALMSASFVALLATTARAQYPHMLKDMTPGPGSSDQPGFHDWFGNAVWPFSTAAEGIELWVSDGTTAGTRLLKDINPGPAPSISSSFSGDLEFNGWIYFSANDGVHGNELWRSDGTTLGTTLVYDFDGAPTSSSPTLYKVGPRLIIAATTPALGTELWISDGTAAGTQLIADINPGPASSFNTAQSSLSEFQGKLWFLADDGVHGSEPWISDGTANGTNLFMDIRPGPGSSVAGHIVSMTGGLGVFRASDGVTGSEPWVTDGTVAGTTLLGDLYPGPTTSGAVLIGELAPNGVLFYASTPSYGQEPWITDGTPAGTVLLADLQPGTIGSIVEGPYIINATTAVGVAYSTATGVELWATDGTPAGTRFLELQPGSMGSVNWPSFSRVGSRIFVHASQGASGLELATSDGTVAGTYVMKDLVPGQVGTVSNLLPIGDGVIHCLNTSLSTTNVLYGNAAPEFNQYLMEAPGQPLQRYPRNATFIGKHIFCFLEDPLLGFEPFVIEVDGDGDGVVSYFDAFNFERDCFCTATLAPCGNSDPTAGCANSTGVGARLDGSGTTLLANDDLVLSVSQLPPNVNGLMFMGASAANSLPFYDGVRCVSTPLARWPGHNAGPSGTMTYGPGLAAQASGMSAAFHLFAGSTWRFQAWYRNSAGPCGLRSNLSNSATVVFTP